MYVAIQAELDDRPVYRPPGPRPKEIPVTTSAHPHDTSNAIDHPHAQHEMHLVYDICTILSESSDMKRVLSSVLAELARHLGVDRGTITILNRMTGEIAIEEAYGLDESEVARGVYLVGEGITGRVIDTGEAVAIPRIAEEPRFLDRTGSRKSKDKRDISFACVPIKIGFDVIGAIGVDRRYEDGYDLQSLVRILTVVASTISLSVRLRQENQEEIRDLREENSRLHAELHTKYRPENVIGNSKIMRDLYRHMEQVSATNATVLLLGESGVGKEKIAHAIHYGSPRAGKPFIKVNCAAIPESLIESELFGHERGAFTDATAQRKGRFELADSGTIFLDEIGEMPPSAQSKFLRVLQEREFERIGGTETIKINVRIIAATNRDLPSLIASGRFREDLYYRLAVFPLVVPPLRERKTDIILLANHFAEKFSGEHRKGISRISPAAMRLLMAHDWPGNVRELENCVERAVILATEDTIQASHLPPSLQSSGIADESAGFSLTATIEAIEREMLREALRETGGNLTRAAQRLGISERVMGLRAVKYGLRDKEAP